MFHFNLDVFLFESCLDCSPFIKAGFKEGDSLAILEVSRKTRAKLVLHTCKIGGAVQPFVFSIIVCRGQDNALEAPSRTFS